MSNTNKRSAAFQIHHVVPAATDEDKATWTYVASGYKNRNGSTSLLIGADWQLVNKKTGEVLEAATRERDDGTTYNDCVKLYMQPTARKATKAA